MPCHVCGSIKRKLETDEYSCVGQFADDVLRVSHNAKARRTAQRTVCARAVGWVCVCAPDSAPAWRGVDVRVMVRTHRLDRLSA